MRWAIDLDGTHGGGCFVKLSGDPSDKRDRGKPMLVPTLTRTTRPAPKLLTDNAEYVLGIGEGGAKTAERHQLFRDLTERCAAQSKSDAVKAVAEFLAAYTVDACPPPDDLTPADTITFRVNGVFPVDLPEVRTFWAAETVRDGGGAMQCLVCGQTRQVEERMPGKVKGIPGGQMSGTAIISANAQAFESYGLEASLIAPTCRDCAESFTNALNGLIRDPKRHVRVGPSVFVFWTREDMTLSLATLLSQPAEEDVGLLLKSCHTGETAEALEAEAFFALSLSASGGRAVVRDWLETTVPRVRRNLARWFALQSLVDSSGAPGRPFGVYALAASLYLRPNDQMVADVPRALVRCALYGGALPDGLLFQAVRRNAAEQGVTRNRMALIKAVLMSQMQLGIPKEDPMSELDMQCREPAYACGRLLAELEAAQRAALPGIKATLVDRYFGAASSAPASVFGQLLRAAQPHLAKLRKEREGAFLAIDKRLQEIMASLEEFPATLNLKQQALFSLGYYHQKAYQTAAIAANRERKAAEAAQKEEEDK